MFIRPCHEAIDGAGQLGEEPISHRLRAAIQRERAGTRFHRRPGDAPGQLVAAVEVAAVRSWIAHVGTMNEVSMLIYR